MTDLAADPRPTEGATPAFPRGRAPGRLRLAVLLLTLVGALWALVTPLGAVPDEPAHLLYAAGVVRGQHGGGPQGRDLRLPAGIASASQATCPAFRPAVTADCIADVTGGGPEQTVATSAAHYPPLFYVLDGWPTLLAFGEATWYAMRLLSVLLGAGLLLAGASAWRRDPPALAAGVVLAATPMTAFLLGSVNPNGAEVAAGVAVVLGGTGLLDRVRAGDRPSARTALVSLVLPAGYLALERPGSVVLAAALAVVLAVLALPARRRLRGQPRLVAAAAGGVVAGLVLGSLQTLLSGGTSAAGAGPVPGGRMADLVAVLDQVAGRLVESVGLLGWRDHAPPVPLRLSWLALVATLVLLAWAAGHGAERAALVLLIGCALVLVPLAFVSRAFPLGEGYQARYAMAVLQAVPVLGGAVLAGEPEPLPLLVRRLLALLPGTTVTLGLLALTGSLLRYAVGLPLPVDPRRVLHGWVWTPPAWPLALVVLVAVLATAWQLRRALLRDDELS